MTQHVMGGAKRALIGAVMHLRFYHRLGLQFALKSREESGQVQRDHGVGGDNALQQPCQRILGGDTRGGTVR